MILLTAKLDKGTLRMALHGDQTKVVLSFKDVAVPVLVPFSQKKQETTVVKQEVPKWQQQLAIQLLLSNQIKLSFMS